MTRDERQEIARQRWIKAKCCGTLVAGTGFGKSRVAINCITSVLGRYPSFKVLIIVPSIGLKEQWEEHVRNNSTLNNHDVKVMVINSAVKQEIHCDLLIIDEIHRAAATSLVKIFEVVKYRIILGLTATFERLDERHKLIEKYCPVFDTVSIVEARANGWVSDFKEYQVMLEVDDIDVYKQYNKDFIAHFEFFNFDFNLVMSLAGKDGWKRKSELRDRMCPNGTFEERKRVMQQIAYHAAAFNRALQARKKFVNNHVKKLEVTRKIIEAYPDSKIITFSNNIKMAESIGYGHVYSGQDSKKKGRMTIQEYSEQKSGVLNTIRRADEGLDVPGISIVIMLGLDSSKTRRTQRIGRGIRVEGDKYTQIFTLVLTDTIEEKWVVNSNINSDVMVIDEQGLYDVLEGRDPKPYRKKMKNFQFRY